ncbi:MAG: EB domain-containing protein [Bacteroidota bacterium]
MKINLLRSISWSFFLVLCFSACQDPCENVVCLNGEICLDGTCVNACEGVSCPSGEICVNGECVDPCADLTCLNGGTCVDGTCECPPGFSGPDCSVEELPTIQSQLDDGVPPFMSFSEGISLDRLYGKVYEGGLIFYLNTMDGSGLVASDGALNLTGEWGCANIDIPDLVNVPITTFGGPYAEGAMIGDGKTNTDSILAAQCTTFYGDPNIIAQKCRDLGEEWSLPSLGELDLIIENLHNNGYGNYKDDTYVSSSEFNDTNILSRNFQFASIGGASKVVIHNFCAVKAF